MTRPLYVAFVGMKRAPSSVADGYWPSFVKCHLELPWYYARYSDCRVHLTTTEPVEYSESFQDQGGGTISTLSEGQFLDPFFKEDHHPYDLVIHWRKWHEDLYVPGARNVVVLQDHSYGEQWKKDVIGAYQSGKMEGFLCFPTWHKENTIRELGGAIPAEKMYDNLTMGVDTTIFYPNNKDPFQMLWASDLGRGLDNLINPFLRLWAKDRRFTLNVVYPDYVKPEMVARFSHFLKHPGVRHLGCVPNGQALWDLFNRCGILPYASTFPEPFSRAVRQAMSAGSMVLYPPEMGCPSRVIENNLTGIIEQPEHWPDIISSFVSSGRWEEIGKNARTYAISESWPVYAKRFHSFFTKDLT